MTKKTLKEIAKEMGISIKEVKDIFDYLVKIDKLDKPKK
jgi:cytidylate kinase